MTIKRIVAISDTHSMHRRVALPPGDFLIHSGDISARGLWHEFTDFAAWMDEQPHPHKIFVLGNHDGYGKKECKEWLAQRHPNVHVLFNESIELGGLKLWGSPFTPEFCEWHWMLNRGKQLAAVWKSIPADLDVLVTHGPAYGHGDLAPAYNSNYPRAVGCFELLKKIVEVKPKIHIFGHIHCGYGRTLSDECPTLFVNAATCTEQYQPTNPPQVIDLEVKD